MQRPVRINRGDGGTDRLCQHLATVHPHALGMHIGGDEAIHAVSCGGQNID